MKTLSDSGTVLIVGTKRFPQTKQHRDIWQAHAVSFAGPTSWMTHSGMWVFAVEFELKDGQFYVYIERGLTDAVTNVNMETEWFDIPFPPLNYPATGEIYNYNFRSGTTNKIPSSDFPLWLATH